MSNMLDQTGEHNIQIYGDNNQVFKKPKQRKCADMEWKRVPGWASVLLVLVFVTAWIGMTWYVIMHSNIPDGGYVLRYMFILMVMLLMVYGLIRMTCVRCRVRLKQGEDILQVGSHKYVLSDYNRAILNGDTLTLVPYDNPKDIVLHLPAGAARKIYGCIT